MIRKAKNTVHYYDSRYNVAQVRTANYPGGIETTCTSYSFTGKPMSVKTISTSAVKGTLEETNSVMNAELQPYKYNGKEFDKMHGLNTYDYGARQYNPVTARWDRMDPLCEKYYSMSPYAYCGNNPVRYIDPDGMYFDESNEKKAKKIERKAERRAAKLEHKAIRKEMRGKDPGNLKERAQELRKSAQDIRDMREEKSIEFCFAKANNVNNPAGKGHPNTDIIGTNDKGDPIICMLSESNMGSRLHEIRHGGQFKRGEIYLDKTNYCVYHEIDAYRAQFSWNGFLVIYKEVTVEDVMSAISNHSLTIESNIRVSSFDEINVDFVKSLKDPNDMFIYNFE